MLCLLSGSVCSYCVFFRQLSIKIYHIQVSLPCFECRRGRVYWGAMYTASAVRILHRARKMGWWLTGRYISSARRTFPYRVWVWKTSRGWLSIPSDSPMSRTKSDGRNQQLKLKHSCSQRVLRLVEIHSRSHSRCLHQWLDRIKKRLGDSATSASTS